MTRYRLLRSQVIPRALLVAYTLVLVVICWEARPACAANSREVLTGSNLGQILFVGSPESDDNVWRLCILSAGNGHPTIQALPTSSSVWPSSGFRKPKWGRSDRDVYYLGLSPLGLKALWHLDRRVGTSTAILAEGTWWPPGFPDTNVFVLRDDGFEWAVYPAFFRAEINDWECGKQSGSVYTLLNYSAKPTPPGFRYDVDSLRLPAWMVPLVKPRVVGLENARHDSSWYNIVAVDTTGVVSPVLSLDSRYVAGISVSPDENLIAYTPELPHIKMESGALWLRQEVRIFDRRTETERVPPGPDTTITLTTPSFSPDGSRLAVLGGTISSEGIERRTVFLSEAPDFKRFDLLVELDQRLHPAELSWSPDGEWFLLFQAHIFDDTPCEAPELILVEAATGELSFIRRPYRVNGEESCDFFIESGIDWIE